MKAIKVKTPAKINLTLEVLNRREDGFHNIQSIMQTVSLYDYLTFKIEKANDLTINLFGNSNLISYDNSNLIYKAAAKFFEKTKIKEVKLSVYLEKNIPVAAGLAGGSTNASGTLFALNKLYDNVLNKEEIDELCASLGSDINFCFYGGCSLCTSRGEKIEKLPFYKTPVSLIKPKNIGISTKEAYMKFSSQSDKAIPDNTTKLKMLLLKHKFDKNLLYNSLEKALFHDYEELRTIKNNVKDSFMSGSGSTFFTLSSKLETSLDKSKYDVFENLVTTNTGVEEINE